jgi:hypothetical protein
MPLPVPRGEESQSDFISRCMGDSIAAEEFPDTAQRRAVCQSQWAKRVSKNIVESTKISKRDAGYSCPASSKEVRCGTCAYFDGSSGCTEVAGEISENCVSNKWTARQ